MPIETVQSAADAARGALLCLGAGGLFFRAAIGIGKTGDSQWCRRGAVVQTVGA